MAKGYCCLSRWARAAHLAHGITTSCPIHHAATTVPLYLAPPEVERGEVARVIADVEDAVGEHRRGPAGALDQVRLRPLPEGIGSGFNPVEGPAPVQDDQLLPRRDHPA